MTTVLSAVAAPLRVGIIGLGMIGSGVAASLVRSAMPPAATYDVRPDASAAIAGLPAQSPNPAALGAASDVVLLAVVTAQQAREVLFGAEGVLAVDRPGMLIVLLSTVTVDAVHELDELCRQRGAILLDAAVTGGGRAAQNGLVVMIGGPDEAVARALPALEGFARSVVHCGALGTGMVAKLARNAITYGQWALVREASRIAEAGKVPLGRLLTILTDGQDDGTDALSMLKSKVAGMTLTPEQIAYVDGLAQKDLGAAQEFARSAGIGVPIVDLVRPTMGDVVAGRLEDTPHA